jgi:hypothetical protein
MLCAGLVGASSAGADECFGASSHKSYGVGCGDDCAKESSPHRYGAVAWHLAQGQVTRDAIGGASDGDGKSDGGAGT